MALHDSGRPLEFSEDAHFWEEEDERRLNEIVDLLKRNKIRPVELNAIINSLPFIRKYFKEVVTADDFKKKCGELCTE